MRSSLIDNASAGYTLIETLVAMALFLGIVIPTGALVVNVMLKTDTRRDYQALRIAVSELAQVEEETVAGSVFKVVKDGFKVEETIDREHDVVTIVVTVRDSCQSSAALIKLHKKIHYKRHGSNDAF